MADVGIVRKIDNLGRVVIPKEIRGTIEIECRDPLEIYVEGDYILLKKYQPQCVLCGSMDELAYFKGKNICNDCIGKI